MGNEKEEKISKKSSTVIEIPSTKKFILGGKVITMSPRKEAEAIAGEKISKEELKARIVAGVKQNGEEKKEKQENKEKKFDAKRLIPIVIVPLLLLSLAKGCTKDVEQPIFETIPINEIVYKVDNPYPILEGIVNSYGQEGMTANAMEGNAFNGNHYTSAKQAEAEEKASAGTLGFEQMQGEIDENLEILTNANTTQEEKETAAKRLLELSGNARQEFLDNEEFAKTYAEKFEAASLAYKDSNSENEIITVNQMVENFMSELGLSSLNVEAIQNIVDAFEQGYELELGGKELADGDFIITGEGIREVAKNEGVNKSVWQKFKNFLKGDRERANENEK